MKFIQEKTLAFQPFDLRIESQDEATLLATLLGNTPQSVTTAVASTANVHTMYKALSENGFKGMYGVKVELNGRGVSPVIF